MSSQLKFCIGTKAVTTFLSHGTTLSRIKNFAYGIQHLTNAEIRRVWATVGDGVSIAEKSGTIKSLSHYAHIFVRQASTEKLYAVKIISPNYNQCFNDDQEVLIETGEHVAELYSALAAEEFSFAHGALAGPSFS